MENEKEDQLKEHVAELKEQFEEALANKVAAGLDNITEAVYGALLEQLNGQLTELYADVVEYVEERLSEEVADVKNMVVDLSACGDDEARRKFFEKAAKAAQQQPRPAQGEYPGAKNQDGSHGIDNEAQAKRNRDSLKPSGGITSGTLRLGEAIQKPNSSGQGTDPDYAQHPLTSTCEKHGFSYSHSTGIRNRDGTTATHHTFQKPGTEHKVGVMSHNTNWESKVSSASSHSHSGTGAAELDSHLQSKVKRYPELRESTVDRYIAHAEKVAKLEASRMPPITPITETYDAEANRAMMEVAEAKEKARKQLYHDRLMEYLGVKSTEQQPTEPKSNGGNGVLSE